MPDYIPKPRQKKPRAAIQYKRRKCQLCQQYWHPTGPYGHTCPDCKNLQNENEKKLRDMKNAKLKAFIKKRIEIHKANILIVDKNNKSFIELQIALLELQLTQLDDQTSRHD